MKYISNQNIIQKKSSIYNTYEHIHYSIKINNFRKQFIVIEDICKILVIIENVSIILIVIENKFSPKKDIIILINENVSRLFFENIKLY